MTSKDFVHWLKGFYDLHYKEGEELTPRQADLIQRHLNMVFFHEIEQKPSPKVQARKVAPEPKMPRFRVDPTKVKINC